jgi:acyl-CoA thioesterase-1
VTAGTGITVTGIDNKSKAWPAVLQNKVNIPVINAGVSGDTTAQGLARVDRDVLSKNPKIVIIVLGGNDNGQRIPVDITNGSWAAINATQVVGGEP